MRISDWSSDVCSSDLVTSPPATGMTGKVSGPRLGGLVLQHLGLLARGDGDAPRPLGLGDLAHQLDGEQAVLEPRTGHLDVVGKVEAPLEGTGGDAAMEILHPVRSEERRVGEECVSTWRLRWSPVYNKKHKRR